MSVLGFTHPNGGRPVPGTALDGFDVTVDGLLERLEMNPTALDEHTRESVGVVVRRFHHDVAPWPFLPLVG
jgi:hypothetical protein